MLRPVRVTPPVELPVTLAEARAQCRIDGAYEDRLLEGLLNAAVDHLDGYGGLLGRCLIDQVWRQDFIGWGCLRLPFPDCKDVAVTWRDPAGVARQVADFWIEDGVTGPQVRMPSWPPGSLARGLAPVSVTFTAGYGDQLDVPQSLKQAILMLVDHWYTNRSAVAVDMTAAAMPFAVQALIDGHRVWRV